MNPLTLKSMQWVGVVWKGMEVIPIFSVKLVVGLGFEMLCRRNERGRDAGATKQSC